MILKKEVFPMEQTDQTPKHHVSGRLVGSLVLAAAIVIGCVILAYSFARNYYSSGGGSFPSEFMAQIESVDSDYLTERQAVAYLGLGNWIPGNLWEELIDSGALEGTYVTFVEPVREDEYVYKDGVIRVFSKVRLDEWMQAKFAQVEE